MKQPAIYIVSNFTRSVLYIGVTSHIQRRAYEHKEGMVDGFSQTYKCKDLIYYEPYPTMEEAITREKQLKKWSRKKKDILIARMNPELKDLYCHLINV